jgi:3-keto-5-aminohexanoate cleavage enzyme
VIEVSGRFQDTIVAFTSANVAAKPDIMSLNPGPMTFRGSGGSPSRVAITTFDETARMANDYRAHGVKPQVFLYHPGHLDLLDHLIRFDAIDPPYFVQLVFGQQSGIPATSDAFALMVRHLPEQSVYQTCGLGPDSIAFNLLALQAGGHARTGMEDSLDLLPGVPAKGNGPLVSRVASIARSIGREIATPSQARETLGI